jgi:hypothetical protein
MADGIYSLNIFLKKACISFHDAESAAALYAMGI